MIASVALVIALGGNARSDPRPSAAAAGNVEVVKSTFTVSNGNAADGYAQCPKGTKVISGGFASTGQHARINVAGPARRENRYIVYAFTPPVNISAGVTSETAKITVVALCAPAGKALIAG